MADEKSTSTTNKVIIGVALLLGAYWLYRKLFVHQPSTVVTPSDATSGTPTTSNTTSGSSSITTSPLTSVVPTVASSSSAGSAASQNTMPVPVLPSGQPATPVSTTSSGYVAPIIPVAPVAPITLPQPSTQPITFPSNPPVETFPAVAAPPVTFPTTDVAAQNNVSYSERQMNINNIVCTTDSNGIIQNTYSSFNQTLLSDYINQFDVTSDELSTARDYCLSSGMTPIVSSPASQPVVMPAPILPSSDVTNIQYDSMGQQIQSFI